MPNKMPMGRPKAIDRDQRHKLVERILQEPCLWEREYVNETVSELFKREKLSPHTLRTMMRELGLQSPEKKESPGNQENPLLPPAFAVSKGRDLCKEYRAKEKLKKYPRWFVYALTGYRLRWVEEHARFKCVGENKGDGLFDVGSSHLDALGRLSRDSDLIKENKAALVDGHTFYLHAAWSGYNLKYFWLRSDMSPIDTLVFLFLVKLSKQTEKAKLSPVLFLVTKEGNRRMNRDLKKYLVKQGIHIRRPGDQI